MLKRILLGSTMALLAALALAAPSQARVKASCVVHGTAKTQDKVLPMGVRLVGGGGTYTWNSLLFICTTLPGGKVPAGQTYTIEVTSNGKYSNVMCGTGKAYSAPGQTIVESITGGDPANHTKIAAVIAGIEYKVVFGGFGGVFYTNNAPDPTGPKTDVPVGKPDEFEDPSKPIEGGALVEAGTVNLSPPTFLGKVEEVPDVLNGECTKAFDATGVLKIYR